MAEPIAILSDIHANLEALEAILDDIDKKGIKTKHSLGDIVGYGPNPVWCAASVYRNFESAISGNHEEAVCYYDLDDPEIQKHYRSRSSIESLKWTKKMILHQEPAVFDYLKSLSHINLPDKDELQRNIAEVHGALCAKVRDFDIENHASYHPKKDQNPPHSPIACASINSYTSNNVKDPDMLDNLRRCFNSLKSFGRKICFVGHLHLPEANMLRPEDGDIPVSHHLSFGNNHEEPVELPIRIRKDAIYVVNPGSVGQPRDRNPRASYCIYTGDEIIFRRVPYKYRTTMVKLITRHELSKATSIGLAFRLAMGA